MAHMTTRSTVTDDWSNQEERVWGGVDQFPTIAGKDEFSSGERSKVSSKSLRDADCVAGGKRITNNWWRFAASQQPSYCVMG